MPDRSHAATGIFLSPCACSTKTKPIGIPLQHFDFIMAAAYEDKGGAFVQVQCEAALYDGCKAIDGFAHIYDLRC